MHVLVRVCVFVSACLCVGVCAAAYLCEYHANFWKRIFRLMCSVLGLISARLYKQLKQSVLLLLFFLISVNEKLKKKNQHFQRLLLQAQQKLKSQASLRVAAQSHNVSSGASTSGGTGTENLSKEMITSQSSNVPRTAAVKPTATPSTSVPVRLINTPTASIRPMAVTTTTAQPTPTATVPPTVTTQPTAAANVCAVSEPIITVTSVAFRAQSSTNVTEVAPVTPPVSSVLPSVSSEVTSSPSVSVRPITSSNTSTVVAMETSSTEVNEERPPDIVVSVEERPSTTEVSASQTEVEPS